MKVGILGGGQLSRMLALAGTPLGLDFYFLEPNKPCCTEQLGQVFYADYQDHKAIEAFTRSVDVVTYENENIPVETVERIQRICSVFPDEKAIRISQDRLLEKQFFESLNIPTVPYLKVDSKQELMQGITQLDYPVILKKRRGGYDGKSQVRLNTLAEVESLANDMCTDALIEKQIVFQREVSLVVARGQDGETRAYDLCENRHKDGILESTSNIPLDPSYRDAYQLVDAILSELKYTGVLTLELFQVEGQLLANEMAPRVHNSGHWTIEGAKTSQFENHLRALMGWPLGSTESLGFSSMHNIIGTFPEKKNLLCNPDLHLHDYQKAARPGRKIGHVTVVEKTNLRRET